MASKSPFADLLLNIEAVEKCLVDAGALDVTSNSTNPKELKYTFSFDGEITMLKFFPKKGGLYTVGKAVGLDAHFDKFANEVKDKCCVVSPKRMEFTVRNLDPQQFADLFEFLQSEEVEIQELNQEAHCKIFSAKGKFGDVVRIKQFNNKSIQFQGRFLNTAILINDFFCNVLNYQDLLAQQIGVFKIPVTGAQVKAELLNKIPATHHLVDENIRKQISCSIALCKVDIELEDYSAVSFPALRGLEGFLIQLLSRNFRPGEASKIGEYFLKNTDQTTYSLTPDHAAVCDQDTAEALGECYTYWRAQRHGTFHMSSVLAATRTLSAADAIRICDEVCGLIDKSCKRLP